MDGRALILAAAVGCAFPCGAHAQSLADSLESVLRGLAEEALSPEGREYERTRPFFADSVSCFANADADTTCPGPGSGRLSFASGLIRARLIVGPREEGWAFDWDSFRVLAAGPEVAVATVRWEAPPRDTVVETRCDPERQGKSRRVGLWTWVFVREDGSWKITHAHETVSRFTSYEDCTRGADSEPSRPDVPPHRRGRAARRAALGSVRLLKRRPQNTLTLAPTVMKTS